MKRIFLLILVVLGLIAMCHGATTSAEVSLVEEGEEDSSEETSEVVTPEDEESDRFFFFPRFKCNVLLRGTCTNLCSTVNFNSAIGCRCWHVTCMCSLYGTPTTTTTTTTTTTAAG